MQNNDGAGCKQVLLTTFASDYMLVVLYATYLSFAVFPKMYYSINLFTYSHIIFFGCILKYHVYELMFWITHSFIQVYRINGHGN